MTIFIPAEGGGTPTGVAGVYDYNSLKQAVQDWFARSDLGNWIDYFIQMGEQKIYRDIFALNQGSGVKPMEMAFTGTIATDGTMALPDGYLGLKNAVVNLDGNSFQLQRRNAEFIFTQFAFRGAGGSPEYIARQGSSFIFGPSPDGPYTITGIYWRKFPQLTVVNTTTWMTDTIPTILLAAVNGAAARFNKDGESLQMWDAEYASQLRDFLLADRAEEQSGSAFAMVAG
jgi:hypothetical protein